MYVFHKFKAKAKWYPCLAHDKRSKRKNSHYQGDRKQHPGFNKRHRSCVEEDRDQDHSAPKHRKRGQYHVYDKTRVTMARVAEECGLTRACARPQKFIESQKPTVQSIRNAYQKQLLVLNQRSEEMVKLVKKDAADVFLELALDKEVIMILYYWHAL